jgi:hypothetical protein
MAAALLAKLKINNPPMPKQNIEINIKGKDVGQRPALERPAGLEGEGEKAIEIEKKAIEEEGIEEEGKKVAAAVKIIDESKKANFDRNTFLKSFKRPKIVMAASVPPAVAGPIAPAPLVKPKKQVTRKLTIKNKAILPEQAVVPAAVLPGEAPLPLPLLAAVQAEAEAEAQAEALPAVAPKIKLTIRRTKKPIIGVKEGPLGMITIGDADMETRLKKKREAPVVIPASAYYMNNREIFINFMSSLFGKYKKKLADEAAAPATCPGDGDVNEFSLMTHQQIVRDYLNLYTPYRGLLLYHGLGSGKTCSSIAIAEGMKTAKPVIVMTPASLQVNYREELKKCGDELYKKNQFWEFIRVGKGTNTGTNTAIIDSLSSALSLSVEYITKEGGAWLLNTAKQSNYDALSPIDKVSLDKQIDQMIMHKYRFINYNGLRATKVLELTKNNTINPFDGAVVIVDEAHNLVSRIVNKLSGKQGSIALTLYSLLMKAKNAKIILLTGTPIINFPNEIGILFNILRGLITTWSLKLDISEQRQINTAYFQSLFKSTVLGGNVIDLIDYKPSSTTLVITRNPFGFTNKSKASPAGLSEYAGVRLEIGERGEISDATFIELITRILNKNNIKVRVNGVSVSEYKALPDTLDEFKNYFIEESGEIKNEGMLKRRILGLTSYFRSAQESLMPKYKKENPADFQVIKIAMSDFQLGVYDEARAQERTVEKRNAKKKKVKKPGVEDLYAKTTSTYRIFSRLFCNFVFPRPAIARPMPDKKNKVGEEISLQEAIVSEQIDEDVVDAVSKDERMNRDESVEDGDEIEAMEAESTDAEATGIDREATGIEEGLPKAPAGPIERIAYKDRIQNALKALEKNKDKYLTPEALQTYSPKFLHILENIQDEEHVGIHLMYSQFRALEGIGIFKLILEANGFTQFKIKKIGTTWELAIPAEDVGKPTFALYTGTETPEEKEIIRNVLNNAWKYVPETITRKLTAIAPNNNLGEIIKVLMITSSGAEGISLKNVRYVHITEPYWHPVRLEQVIGRARRICSHQALPEALRTVTVFLYIMTFSEAQMKSDNTIELRTNDKSRKDDITPVSTDETLYEIASAKEEITTTILKAVKESSIDCALHLKSNKSENLQCFTFGSSGSDKFAYEPSFNEEQSDAIADKNKKAITWKAKQIELDGAKYALNATTNEVYDLDSYMTGQPVKVADLIIIKGKGKGAAATYKLEFI